MLSNTSSDTEYFLVSVLLLLDLLSRSLSLLLKTNLLEGYIEIMNNKSSDDGFYKTKNAVMKRRTMEFNF